MGEGRRYHAEGRRQRRIAHAPGDTLMGTSSAFGGQGGGTPLVPSWLGNEGLPAAAPDGAASPNGAPPAAPPAGPPAPPPRPPIPASADPTRFSAARNNFSR